MSKQNSKSASKQKFAQNAVQGPLLPKGVSAEEMNENYYNRLARQAIEGNKSPKAP